MTTDSEAYFSSTGSGQPTRAGAFIDTAGMEPIELAPGLTFRPVLGEACMLNVVEFAPHTEAPLHTHEEEQLVIVLDGEIEFTVGDETRTLRKGEAITIPPWLPHGARTLDSSCREIDFFSPPRRNLVTLMQQRDAGSA